MKTILLAVATVLASYAPGQDCTGFWQSDLPTGILGPKSMMGDTNAAYAAYQFYVNTSTVIRLRGSYPFARFLSIESYRTKKNNAFDALYDYQIAPNAGSSNPFVAGKNANNASREYTIDLVPEGTKWTGAANQLKVTSEDDVASVWVRYYAPNPGVTVNPTDIPTIEALDAATGKPAACPQAIEMNFFTNYPQILTYIVPHKTVLDFKPFAVDLAGNSAIPGYPETHSKMRQGEVAVIKFKAPSFDATIADGLSKNANVRYWSLCSINLVKNMGLACLPDYLAHVDKAGFVTLVYGPDEVKDEAMGRGYDFLPDMRERRQKLVTFVYRNILPSAPFKEKDLFKGEYNPSGRLCSEQEFLDKDPGCDPGSPE